MVVFGYLPKLKWGLQLVFSAHFCMIFHKNAPNLIFYQLTKFQCHIFFPSQDIGQNVLLSSYLDN